MLSVTVRKDVRRLSIAKLAAISTNLRSWKSLPDHLERKTVQCWPQDHNTCDNVPTEIQEFLTRAREGKANLCRATSNAQMEYALIRKAIEERNKLDLLNLLNRETQKHKHTRS